MSSRARGTAIGVGVVVAMALLGWWSMTERQSPRGGSDPVALNMPDDGSVPLPGEGGDDSKPHVEPATPQYDSEGNLLMAPVVRVHADGGVYSGEQPAEDYQGEVTDVIDYDPEIVEPPVGPNVVQLTEAQLVTRRSEQLTLIEQTLETLETRIDRVRDEGNESMVQMLEARRDRLRQRRDALADLVP